MKSKYRFKTTGVKLYMQFWSNCPSRMADVTIIEPPEDLDFCSKAEIRISVASSHASIVLCSINQHEITKDHEEHDGRRQKSGEKLASQRPPLTDSSRQGPPRCCLHRFLAKTRSVRSSNCENQESSEGCIFVINSTAGWMNASILPQVHQTLTICFQRHFL